MLSASPHQHILLERGPGPGRASTTVLGASPLSSLGNLEREPSRDARGALGPILALGRVSVPVLGEVP